MTVWAIIGGSDKGGILVREGLGTNTPQKDKRLSTGATVEELSLQGDRLQYKRLTGDGPEDGWISIKLKDKQLAERVGAEDDATEMPADAEMGTWKPLSAAQFAKLPKKADNDKIRPMSLKKWKEQVNTEEPGEYWGMLFPYSPDALKEAGPEWLTKAMHTAGTMPKDNAVTKFKDMKVFAEDVTKQDLENAKFGGAGIKILLTVEYLNGPSETLTEGMFIKMPHAYTGKNERQKNSFNNAGMMDWSEVSFYNIFGGAYGDLPFKVPRMYFCDMARKTSNFVNIVEKIPYGQGVYLTAPDKYRDWDLPNNGIDLYYAHAKALAQFFGWHKNVMKLTDQVEKIFLDEGFHQYLSGFQAEMSKAGRYLSAGRDKKFVEICTNPEIQPMIAGNGFKPEIAKGFLDIAKSLTETAPHVFPEDLIAKKQMDKFFSEAHEMAKYCVEMNTYSLCMPEYFAFTHPNAQVDNAYYWKPEGEDLQCGLLDWGGVSHTNIPTCLGNGWMGAEPEAFDEHEEKVVRCFVDQYEKVTGFKIDYDDLYMQFKLAQAAVLPGCCANMGMLMRIIKKDEWKDIKNRYDPKIDHNFLVRCYYVQVELFMAMFKNRSPYTAFQRWMKKTRLPKKK